MALLLVPVALALALQGAPARSAGKSAPSAPAPAAAPTPPAGKKAPATLVMLVDAPGLPATPAALAAALKKEIERSANYVWKEPPPVSVDEILVALNCKKLDVKCMFKMGDILQA